MSNKIERYLRKKVFSKNDRISIILHKHEEIKKFLELCKKYDIFTNEKSILWCSGNPFIKDFYDIILEFQDDQDKYNPSSEEFIGNLIIFGTITNKDSSYLNLRWSYDSSFFKTRCKIPKNKTNYQTNYTETFTLNEFEEIIKKALNIKPSKQKIKNLKI